MDTKSDPEDRRWTALADELAHTREQIAGFLRSGDQVLTLLVTIVVGLVVALSANYSPTVAVIAPFGLVIPALYAVRLNALIQNLGGYRKALEEQLNADLEHPAYLWESTVAPLIKRPTSAIAQVIFAVLWVVLVVSAVVSLIRADWSLWWIAPLAAGYALTVSIVAWTMRRGYKLFDDTYTQAAAAMRETRDGA